MANKFFDSIAGGAGSAIGTAGIGLAIGGLTSLFGSHSDPYAASNALMEHAQALLQGTQHVANPEAQKLAMASAQAIKNVQARAASEGWDSRTTQVAIQHIQDSLHAALGDAEAQSRVQQAQMMMQRAGLSNEQANQKMAEFQSNKDLNVGLLGATFGGGFPGVWGKQNKSAPVVKSPGAGFTPSFGSPNAIQFGSGVGGGQTVGQAAGNYVLFRDPNTITLNPSDRR